MNKNSNTFDLALTFQSEGDEDTAAALMEKVEPFQESDSVALLYDLLGEGNSAKIDLLVNSAIFGMTATYDRDADNRDVISEEIARLIIRNN